jgi:hypothetical protein
LVDGADDEVQDGVVLGLELLWGVEVVQVVLETFVVSVEGGGRVEADGE